MALSGIGEFIIFGFMPLMIGMLAGRARPAPTISTIAVRLVLPPSGPLPDAAQVTIELVEQRRGESVPPAVAVETMPWHGGGIQDFVLNLGARCHRSARLLHTSRTHRRRRHDIVRHGARSARRALVTWPLDTFARSGRLTVGNARSSPGIT